MVGLGMNLIIVSRNQEKLDNVKLDLEGRKILIDQEIVTVQTDFAKTSPEEYFNKLDVVMKDHGINDVKLVINNVGHGPHGPYQLASLEEIKNSI